MYDFLEGKEMCGLGEDPADRSKIANLLSSVLHFWGKKTWISLRCQPGLVSLPAIYFPSIFINKDIILL